MGETPPVPRAGSTGPAGCSCGGQPLRLSLDLHPGFTHTKKEIRRGTKLWESKRSSGTPYLCKQAHQPTEMLRTVLLGSQCSSPSWLSRLRLDVTRDQTQPRPVMLNLYSTGESVAKPTLNNRAHIFRPSVCLSTSPQPEASGPLQPPAALQRLRSQCRLREREGRGRKETSISKQSLLKARENGNL